ncbi:MAG: hypothetical protein EOP54_03065 [Sphingobacteriales bacterium]|nr:MAG: hypothetical protein EOP54_03065 [Sphingobacteriales bacterium]
MKYLYIIAFFILIRVPYTFGQESATQFMPIELSFFNNGTFMPGKGVLGVLSPTFHPGLSLGTRCYYTQKDKSQWFQTAKVGYFYHRHAQHGIQLYTELGYRYTFTPAWYIEPKLGAGYLLSIPAMQLFEFKDGAYQHKSFKGRHQFMGGLNISLGYSFQKSSKLPLDVFIGYQFWIQSPFVNKYVPVLPNNSVHIGGIYYFKKSKSKQ